MKTLNLWLWKDGYAEHVTLIKCEVCGLSFKKPEWHYCKCPMCGDYLWDDRI